MRKGGRRAEAVGNVGRPLSLLAGELGPADLAVAEVSSFQLETVSTFAPRVGVVLNLAPDHLDRYPDLAAYYAAKQVLAGSVPADGTFVTWTGCPEARAWPTAARRVLFGDPQQGAGVRWEDGRLVADLEGGPQALIAAGELALTSPPNLLNALASVAAAAAVGTPATALAAGLRDFRGLPHRHQRVGRRGGVVFIDDSKATNVHAVCGGLAGWQGEVVLIVGGSGKGEDYTPLRRVMGAGAPPGGHRPGRPGHRRGAAGPGAHERGRRHGRGRGPGRGPGRARRRGAAEPGLRELRHVRQLPPARRGLRRRRAEGRRHRHRTGGPGMRRRLRSLAANLEGGDPYLALAVGVLLFIGILVV